MSDSTLIERVTWEQEDKKALRQRILKFVEKNKPMVKRSDIVHEFAKDYRGGVKGESRTYIYQVINSLVKAGFLKVNSFDPKYITLTKSLE